jgi:hypothetical protein
LRAKDIKEKTWEAKSEEAKQRMDINMVFHMQREFCFPKETTAQLGLGAERTVFEKPDVIGQHMRPLYIRGHLDGTPVNHMLVDGGACVNIMSWAVFEKLGDKEEELLMTNMMLSGFSGEARDAKGIISMELTVGSKSMPMAFFVVDVNGRYNILLGRDWIYANGCVLSMLHQCVIQWVGDEVDVIQVDVSACITLAMSPGDFQDKEAKCLTGRDLSEFDYISVGQGGFMLVSVKPMIVTRLENVGVHNVK